MPEGLKILADADRVRQVLLNVLLNAVQSMAHGGEVRVEGHHDDAHVTLLIRDQGCGMDDDQLGQIFSPFFTTKERGTGLGLAITRKIVEGHGGLIHAESAPGAGTTLHLRLPRAE